MANDFIEAIIGVLVVIVILSTIIPALGEITGENTLIYSFALILLIFGIVGSVFKR